MKTVGLFAALLASACIGNTDHFVLDYEERSLGVGLEYTFMPMRIVCELGQEFPYACDQRRVTIDQVSASGAGEIRASDDDGFTMYARGSGTALVDLRATVVEDGAQQLADTFDVPVLPIAYSQIGWYSSDTITELTGAAFRSSSVTVWQHHYREPRDQLVSALTSMIVAAELDGDAAFKLAPETTSAALVVADGNARHAAEIATGDIAGTATVHTTAGGAFALDIVDETAIARLAVELRTESGVPGSVVLKPFDATDRPILGCPRTGPTITDTAGAVVIAATRATPWTSYCELELAWVESAVNTTVVVQWGGREARMSIEVP